MLVEITPQILAQIAHALDTHSGNCDQFCCVLVSNDELEHWLSDVIGNWIDDKQAKAKIELAKNTRIFIEEDKPCIG